MNLDELIQLQVLKLKASKQNPMGGKLLDAVIESGDTPIELRQMCAKVSVQLYDRLTAVCELLDMSKRQFIEAAVVEALAKAEELIERSGALKQGEL